MVILVIVESNAKTKKIDTILGDNYKTIASFGHVIDLDPKKMSIDFETFEPTYITIKGKEDVVSKLKKEYKNSDDILLASDPDREGEAIAWTISTILKLKNPKRVAFDSITKDVVKNAIDNPREIDMNLVHAQQARRILDRIIGYEISPILWRTIGMSLSAGRVQSVVVRLIIERENEIKDFFQSDISSYFKFTAIFKPNLESVLTKNNKQVKIEGKDDAMIILGKCSKSTFKVGEIEKKNSFRNPSPPFSTASFQQEASKKLGFSVKKTMTIAQHLYESGYITYMRTDSTNISKEAMEEIKETVLDMFGEKYFREKIYKSKKANTQEAHEAIRPTHPKNMKIEKNKYGEDGDKLYNLIWKRTMASQMSPAKLEIIDILIDISNLKEYKFISEFENIIFDGYMKVYGKEEKTTEIKVNKGDVLDCNEIKATQEYKRPPTRYDEASLVKELSPEHLNIGRPSTYSTIIEKIQDRNYVKKEDINGFEKEKVILRWNGKKIIEENEKIMLGKEINKFIPTDLGKVVTEFLVSNFKEIMDFEFTADMEVKLDNIAEGKISSKKVLSLFYDKFHPLVEELKKKTKELKNEHTRELGKHPNGFDIIATIARFGAVVKMCNPENKKDCVFAPIKEPLTIETITLDDAIKLLEYPKKLGEYEGKEVKLMKGKFGFYIKHGKENVSFDNKENSDENKITLEKAIEFIKEKQKGKLWEDIDKKGTTYTALEGKFGKYVKVKPTKGKSRNVKIPDDLDVKDLTIDKVIELLSKKKKFRKFTKKNK